MCVLWYIGMRIQTLVLIATQINFWTLLQALSIDSSAAMITISEIKWNRFSVQLRPDLGPTQGGPECRAMLGERNHRERRGSLCGGRWSRLQQSWLVSRVCKLSLVLVGVSYSWSRGILQLRQSDANSNLKTFAYIDTECVSETL